MKADEIPAEKASGELSRAVGIIGLGLMGDALRKMLGDAGFVIHGWDRETARCFQAQSASEVFANCDRIFLCLPDATVAANVIRENTPPRGRIIIDTSTGDPREMAELGAQLSAKGVHYLDATISGSSAQLLKREVLVMAGGEKRDFDRCQDLFEAFAHEAVHVGPHGSGAKMKLVTNLVLGLNRAALAEGLVFAGEIGVDPARALDVMKRSMAWSRIMDTKGEKMVTNDFTPQARLAQHLKDVRLMLDATTLPLPMTEAHRKLLERAVALGCGDLDNSAIIKAIQDPAP